MASKPINIVVDMQRMEKLITVDEFLQMQDGDIKAIVSMMSCFVVDKSGKYLTKAKGREVIGALTIAELKETAEVFSQKVVDAAVPPENGGTLEARSNGEPQ